MIYFLESNIPENKSVHYALTHVYGVGNHQAFIIAKKLGFAENLKVKDLTKDQLNKLFKLSQVLGIELASDLTKKKILIDKKLISIKSFRGLRKSQGLPVRGQRTHTNAKTSRKRF
jgi:small subunit ribosomal protein S13